MGVTGPQDLEGHTLGAPAFDGAFAQWPAFVRANGIIEDRVSIEDVGFPVRESMLASGEVDAMSLPDAYVLFNPGFGEPGWADAWTPTIRALLAARKPVLLTALSAADAARDAAFWANVVGGGQKRGPFSFC